MAISNVGSRNTYTLDSVTTDFDITFDCVFDDNGDATEIEVWLIEDGERTEIEKGYTSDKYSVSYKTITYLDATSHDGAELLITRATPRTQLQDFINNGAYNLNQIEAMSDKLTRIEQEQDATIADRILTSEEMAESAAQSAQDAANSASAAALSESNASSSASDAEDWAVGTRSDGQPPQHTSDNAKVYAEDAYVYASDANSRRNDALDFKRQAEGWAVGKRDGVDVGNTSPYYHNNSKYYSDYASSTVGAHSTALTYLDTYSGNVDTVAGISSDIATVASNTSDISTVATDISDVGTVATNISDINTVVTNLTDILAADDYAELSRQYDEGKHLDGTDVTSGEEGYENNAKYWADVASHYAVGTLVKLVRWS